MTDNIFANLPANLDEEVFQRLAGNEQVLVERIISRGHQSPPDYWYDQEKSEWVILLQGEALLGFADGRQVRLGPGDHLSIPAHCRHRVEWTLPDQETIWLAVHY